MVSKQPGILITAIMVALTTAAMPHTTSASELKSTDGIWIDVRTPQEFDKGHLQSAINIPVEHIGTQIATVSINKDMPINLYCRSGRRAETARKILRQLGYTRITNHGGYTDLLGSGNYPSSKN
ncbi:rhodanese-like domain-containing protein [Neisseria sp. S1]|uniref:rhodanese-like domain-containing protein n=1 Tax=Neisseria sp. S1 TaxID=3318354 RepID=UPI003A87414A